MELEGLFWKFLFSSYPLTTVFWQPLLFSFHPEAVYHNSPWKHAPAARVLSVVDVLVVVLCRSTPILAGNVTLWG